MQTTDAKDLESRRALKHVMGRLLTAAEQAQELLKHRATHYPTSCEAEAHRRLAAACADVHRWMRAAGGP